MSRRFQAVLRQGRGGGTLVELPFDVEKAYGARRIKVRATFDGEPYRGSIVFMDGRAVLGVLKAIREKLGKGVGDSVEVTVERDTEERRVIEPDELTRALAQEPQARRAFDALSYTRRKEAASWIAGANKPETRDRRLRRTLERLLGGD